MAKILIIEDEASLVEVYSEYLKAQGHEVLKATDGEGGLEIALSQEWDVMFLDIMLPKLDGIELLRKLNERGEIKGRPIIMLTNLDTEQIVFECINLGAASHLSKADATPEKVADAVLKFLQPKKDNETDSSNVATYS
jgi:DNA-binding response OmpR family regulator